MNKRNFLITSGSVASIMTLGYGLKEWSENIDLNINYVGMSLGHNIRDKGFESLLNFKKEFSDIVICGSGISALSCAWKLVISGFKGKIIMLSGPEKYGNSSGNMINNEIYPTGAHYLPLQNIESKHTREMLKFFNIIEKDEYSEKPYYNSKYLVFSPMERVLINDEWQEGLYKQSEDSHRFFSYIKSLKNQIGSDNKKLFSIPIAHHSKDTDDLDKLSFKQWLDKNNYMDKSLLAHLNYCCKDDYGTTIEQTSAWAGVHYFAARTGKCSNFNHETIMTWKEGNYFLANQLFNFIKDKITFINASCYKIDKSDMWNILATDGLNNNYQIKTNRVCLAMPLFVANKLFNQSIIDKTLISPYSSWIVANILFKSLPKELYNGIGLAYDNVVEKSDKLGYVFGSNQSLDISRDNKVITSYTSINLGDPKKVREYLSIISKHELKELVLHDLKVSYGTQIFNLIEKIDIHIRGHAMCYPEPGFLNRINYLNNKLIKLEQDNLFFSHSDLSSISIFEEASWHGISVAHKILSN